MHKHPWFTIATLGLLLATACDPKRKFDTRVVTISAQGSSQPIITTSESYPANRTAWPCPLNTRGTAPDAPAAGFQSVGYEHAFDKGAIVAPCQWRLNHVHRLVTFFDLRSIPDEPKRVNVDIATLSFDKRRGAGDHECADKVRAVSGPGPEPGTSIRPASDDKFETRVPLLTSKDCDKGRCTMNVTGQVNDWVHRISTNQGFVFIGEDERLDANDNVSCRNEYANFKLEVKFRHDVPAGTATAPVLIPVEIPASTISLNVVQVTRTSVNVTYKLTWSGLPGSTVDLYRDGSKFLSPANSGSFFDTTRLGTTRYKVCKAGSTTTCSKEVTVSS
jgi:hypothetical protein